MSIKNIAWPEWLQMHPILPPKSSPDELMFNDTYQANDFAGLFQVDRKWGDHLGK